MDDPLDTEPTIGVLRRHHLAHLPELSIGSSIRDARLMSGCASGNCTSVCCETGVYADQAERARILEHATGVMLAMDPSQPTNPSAWFEDDELLDADFPSGVGIGTQAGPRGCVFLDGLGKCVLQKAHETGLVPIVLKPFYCSAFPITIYQGILMLDIDNVSGSRTCCQPTTEGAHTVLEVFEWELEHVLGAAGVAELRDALANPR